MPVKDQKAYRLLRKDIIKAERKIYRVKYKEQIAQRAHRYYINNKDKILARKKFKEKEYSATRKKYYLNIKQKVLTNYGNGKCACSNCGFDDIRSLSIDHINGDGAKQRKLLGKAIDGNHIYLWLERNNYPEGYQVLCMNCQWIKRMSNIESYNPNNVKTIYKQKHYLRHKERISNYGKRKRIEIKTEIITHYGNGKLACVKCGFDDIRALSIDHINGSGCTHRKEIPSGTSMYLWLKRNNFPDGYQTLCMNCQYIKRITNGETANKYGRTKLFTNTTAPQPDSK